jgi:hypothetical protein
VLQIIRRLLIRSDRFRLEREFAGPDFHRGERCALPRHTEQSSREFAPAGAAVVVQETALQIAWISLTLSLAERLESEETTGVWFEIEHVCARPRGRD